MYWNIIWKSHVFVPSGANLPHFGLKAGHPALRTGWFDVVFLLSPGAMRTITMATGLTSECQKTGIMTCPFSNQVHLMASFQKMIPSAECTDGELLLSEIKTKTVDNHEMICCSRRVCWIKVPIFYNIVLMFSFTECSCSLYIFI